MLYVLIIGLIFTIIIEYFINKKISIKNIIFSLLLFITLNYLTYQKIINHFYIFQILLFIISYLSILSFKNKKKNKFFLFILFFIGSFYIEFFLFNFRHFTTFFYHEEKIQNYKIEKEEINSTEKQLIKIKKINKKIYNIYLDIKTNAEEDVFPIGIYASDEGNENLYLLGKKNYIKNILQSKYFYVHFYGKVKELSIDITTLESNFTIQKISINKQVSLFFNYMRFLLLFVLITLFYLIRPNSSFYRYKILDKVRYKKFIFMIYILLCMIIFFCLTNINPTFSFKLLDSYDEYYDLTESLIEGHFYLNTEVPEVLKKMKNPYDSVERIKKFTEAGINSKYKWDYAYYKGKFYVYFGILPVIILFLPFYMLFHVHLPLHFAVFIFLMFGVGASLYFVYELCKKYFPKTSLISYFLGVTMLIFMSGFVFIARRPDIYLIPIISALDFMLLGLGLWIDGSNSEKRKKVKIFLGSLCIALTSCCRPQFLISMFLFYPILKDELYDKKWNIKNIICFIIPFILVGLFVMYYNYARFSSIFDFGASYNLTTNDMTRRGFNLDRVGFGLFMYLFEPVNVTNKFPFITVNNATTSYLGAIIYEPFLGGLFWSTSVILIGFYLLKHKKEFDKNIIRITIMTYLFAIVIILFDTQMAGVLPRYICDFAWAFLIPTLFVFFHFDQMKETVKKNQFQKIFFILFIISMLYQFCLIFKYVDIEFAKYSPDIFYKMYYFIEFWM